MNNQLELRITAPNVLKFTFSSIIMMVIMSLYTVVDGTFVSRLIGTDAFSAVNIIYPLLSLTVGIGAMFGSGLTALVSIKLGAGRKKEACENLTFIVLFAIAFGFVLAVLSFLLIDPIIYALGSNEQIYPYCREYVLPLLLFFPANILQLQFQSLYVADGKPQIGLGVTIIGGLTNIILDYVFIAVLDMGIAGAAWGTGLGYSIPAIYGLCYFAFNKKGNLYFVKPKADFRVLVKAAVNGSSEMVSNLSTSVTTLLFNVIMMRLLGQNGVAAISILLYLDFVMVAVSLGYSMGTAPLFSFNYGRGNEENLKKLFSISLKFCAVFGIAVTAGSILLARPLTAIFTSPGTEVYELAVTGLKIYAFNYLFKGFSLFSSAMFTAFGDGRVSAILSFLRTLVFLTATLLGLSALFGVTGVWFASPVAELMAFALSIFYIWKSRKTYGYV